MADTVDMDTAAVGDGDLGVSCRFDVPITYLNFSGGGGGYGYGGGGGW